MKKQVRKKTQVGCTSGAEPKGSFKTTVELTTAVTPPAWYSSQWCCQKTNGNDPSAGSPTETLLRLLLPLNDQV